MLDRNPTSIPSRRRLVVTVALGVLFAAAAPFQSAWAQTAPALGTAQSYAVIAGDAVTNTGATVVNGDIGVFPGTAVGNFTGVKSVRSAGRWSGVGCRSMKCGCD